MKKNILMIVLSLFVSMILWISIALSNKYYSTFDIPLKIINYPEGYSAANTSTSSIKIKLRGSGLELLALKLNPVGEFLVTANADSGKKFIRLMNNIAENQYLTSGLDVIDISPDTVSVLIEKEITKKVKVIPHVKLTYKDGYGLASDILVYPDSVNIIGPRSLIEKFEYAPTQLFEINLLSKKLFEDVNLKNLHGISYEYNQVKLGIDVQQIVEKEMSINVGISDVPPDRDIVLIPNKIDIVLRGGIDFLGKIDENQIISTVNYNDVITDTLGSVIPKVLNPVNTKVINVKPQRLKYVVKKFK